MAFTTAWYHFSVYFWLMPLNINCLSEFLIKILSFLWCTWNCPSLLISARWLSSRKGDWNWECLRWSLEESLFIYRPDVAPSELGIFGPTPQKKKEILLGQFLEVRKSCQWLPGLRLDWIFFAWEARWAHWSHLQPLWPSWSCGWHFLWLFIYLPQQWCFQKGHRRHRLPSFIRWYLVI